MPLTAVDFSDWVPEENTSNVIQRVNQVSAVEAWARRIQMGSNTLSHPRSAGFDVEVVGKSATYGQDDSDVDDVVLTAIKFGKALSIAEEDINDSLPDIINTKLVDWATSYAKIIDNATLAVTGATPFTSVYRSLNTTQSALDYTAADNITQTGSGGVSYDNLSEALGLVEDSSYFDPTQMVVIAHPAHRAELRGVKDGQQRPIFVEGLAGTPDTVFGHPVAWSLGAKTSAAATPSPNGNPLVVFANRDYLLLGVRSGPESMVSTEVGFLSDEPVLKVRARRGFQLGHPKAAAVLEDNS